MPNEDETGQSSNLYFPPSTPWLLGAGWRLFGALFISVFLPTLLFVFLMFLQARASLKEQAVKQNNLAAQLAAKAAQAHFEGLTRYVESFARRQTLIEALQRRSESLARGQLHELVTKNVAFDRAILVDLNGVLMSDYPPDPGVAGRNFSFRDWYQGVSSRAGTYISEIYKREAKPQRYIVSIAVPVRNDNSLLGYLVGQHTMESLSAWLAGIRSPFSGKLFLVDHHGYVASRIGLGEEPPLSLKKDPIFQEIMDQKWDLGSLEGLDPITGEKSVISYEKIKSIEWIVVSTQAFEFVMAPLKRLSRPFLVLTFTFLTGLFLMHSVALGMIHRYHLGQQKAERALGETEQRFQALVESVVDYGIFGMDPNGFVQTWAPGARRIQGYLPQEIIGQHFSVFYTEEDRAQGLPQQLLEKAKHTGRALNTGWRVRKDGTRFWAEVAITAIYDEKGNLRGFSKIARDLTERKRAEEELLQKNQELEKLTRDLIERTHRLQRFHNLTVDRELDMKGLKQEVNQLLDKLGQQKRY